MSYAALDQYIARLQNIDPFEVKKIDAEGKPAPGTIVDGGAAAALRVVDSQIGAAIEVVATEIMWWGRLSANAKRVWQIAERLETSWKASQIIAAFDPTGKPDGWKKPSQAIAEATYRCDPQYAVLNNECERAEEAFNACNFFVDAFKCKDRTLRESIFRAQDGTLQRRSIG